VERLRSLWSGFPSGSRSPSENPDCLVKSPRVVTGIEVTTFSLEPEEGQQSIREQIAIRRRIVARARDIYRAKAAPVLIVDIEFDDAARLTKGDVDELAEAIAELLAAQPFTEEESIGWYQAVPGPMPRGVTAICGGRYRFAESWDGSSGYIKNELKVEHVQQKINNKAKRYAAYRSQCDAVVLLIVVASEHDPRLYVPTAVLEHRYASPFDTTILLLDDVPRAVTLTVDPPVA
jgi:hypothetical protein